MWKKKKEKYLNEVTSIEKGHLSRRNVMLLLISEAIGSYSSSDLCYCDFSTCDIKHSMDFANWKKSDSGEIGLRHLAFFTWLAMTSACGVVYQ